MRALFIVAAAHLLLGNRAFTQEAYDEWLKKEQEKYQDFKDERDRAFSEFLKQEWKKFQSFQGLTQYEEPKPDRLPVAVPVARPPKEKDSAPVVRDLPAPEKPDIIQPEVKRELSVDSRKNPARLDVDFYGLALRLRHDPSVAAELGGDPTGESIGRFWEVLSRSNYEDLLTQVQTYRTDIQLNDWGYCVLLSEVGDGIYGGSRNERYLFVWYMLLKSGYRAKVGYGGSRVYLLLPAESDLYGVPYFTLGGDARKFYAVVLDGRDQPVSGELYTYDQDYPGAERILNVEVRQFPALPVALKEKSLSFEHYGTQHSIDVTFRESAVRFFEYYPQADFQVYFSATASPEARYSLLSGLKPLLEGKSEAEALNLLLHFVQTGFGYRTDQEQFGREKPLFPDESLHYDYSDCEDRSILFSYLVRHLLGLEVVVLDYPGHIATAVRTKGRIEGDAITYGNKTFIVCDPTYIHSDAGMSMPSLSSVSPRVIPIGISQ